MLKNTLFSIGMLVCLASFGQVEKSSLPFWNPQLSFEQRVNDLVGRLTLEEKVAQMLNHTPAIERLGIPAYDWWNEVLHGVARTPYKTTVYPQAIAMAATWDTTSIYTMAEQSATEGRAIYNKSTAEGKSGDRYIGLTYWTPNINIFRDPRWGRGQETYGEDPFLTAMIGKSFVRGLQGNDPKYLRAAACAKHYAVHSGPEPSRHEFNAEVSNYDLWDTYLPAFKELVVDAKVAGVMCAYNAFRTKPCCGSDELMVNILRKDWGFSGYVTSDCGGIDDFFNFHKTHPNAEAASVDAVLNGTDVECGNNAYKSLVDAVKNGHISEEQINTSVKRLFMIRMRLGMFDPRELVKYAQTSESVLESKEHKAQALKMAQQSIVLLKNEAHTLPLSRKIKKLAVFGPNADNSIAVLGNYNGTPSKIVTALEGIRKKLGDDVQITYEQAVNFTNDTLFKAIDMDARFSINGKSGFKAEYFNNKNLSGTPVTRMEKTVDHFWQEGEPVVPTIDGNNFSARYTSNYKAETNGNLLFEIEADDGYRFYVNDSLAVDTWDRNRWGPKLYNLQIKKGATYRLVLEYWQGGYKANVRLSAGERVKTDIAALAHSVKDADAIIFIGGISPQLEGEEMPVNYPGFNGGDRTSIMLPSVQSDLMEGLQTTGKPVIFVMMTGSAIAIPKEQQKIPAILNVWYGGQDAGTAIADVLFGDYNPAGRLPVTFYKSDNDLPAFENYSMDNRTYRYFKGEALFPFGHGLSYTTINYTQLKCPNTATAQTNIPVSVAVTNTGKMAGEEVVQLYIKYPNLKTKAPLKALKGFTRVQLQAGESKTISFNLKPDDLATPDENGNLIYPKGKILISVGGGQPDVSIQRTSNVITHSLTIQ